MNQQAQQAKAIWINILIERFPGEFARLYRIRFDKNGHMVENRNSAYARKHFPNLIKMWERERKK